MKFRNALFALGLLVGTVSGVQAATVTVNQTIDIEALDLNSFGPPSYTALASPVTLSTGDTVDMTVNFANNKAIRLDRTASGGGGFTFWLRDRSPGPSNSFTIGDVTINLFGLNTNGSWVNGANLGSESDGSDHIGWLANASENGLSVGQFLEFSGFNITYDILSSTAGTATYKNIQTSSWGGGASVVAASNVSAVPLPASLPMMVFALGAIALYRRRRTANEI